jgi:translation initiation factor 1
MHLPKDINLVFSTDPSIECHTKKTPSRSKLEADLVLITQQKKGRKGKGVSILKGLNLEQSELKKLCSLLKKQCGCGGSVVQETIELQTQDRIKLKNLLEHYGHQVKISGGST